MTRHSQFFKTYKPCLSDRKITVANGTSATIAGTDNASIFKYLHKKTSYTSQNYRIDLYYLQLLERTTSSAPMPFLSSSNEDAVWLHRFRMDHPSFRVWRIMFPNLFQGLQVFGFSV